MSFSDIVSTAGVMLILAAFFLSTFSIISAKSKIFFLLNLVGAAFACWGCILIHSVPFTILEAVWCAVAVIGLIKNFLREKSN